MAEQIVFQQKAWEDYLYWQKEYKKTLKQINKLIKEIIRNSSEGTGKPEPLRGNLSGWWSRRIDETNRLVYRIKEGRVEIAGCRGHYN
jgi:toxin YoeB